MKKPYLIIIIAFLCVGVLLFVQASRKGLSVVVTPDELLENQDTNRQRIRVAGKVATGSIQYVVEPKMLLSFSITTPGEATEGVAVPVKYHGLKPDMFQAGRDVIIDGDFTDGTLHAATLLTQCPSKYEAPDPAAMVKESPE